ncbi:MAG: substrate-binding domain-containing protein [Rhodocyclaceae bacterium]|nr:substrate-binding domain-containing protein [Rhodocyclaceae bacterium]
MLALLTLALPSTGAADQFAIIGKSSSDANFIAVWRGCNEAAETRGDRCDLVDMPGAANFHRQAAAVGEALGSGRFSGVAISVMSSEAIAKAIRSADAAIPVITFDSPFDDGHAALSRTYVGIDNFAFGREAGRLVRGWHPEGGILCLMTERHDPNLARRVRGVRFELAGVEGEAGDQPLRGEGGWVEHDRCPWYSSDSADRSLYQTRITLNSLGVDAFVSVGHWPILDAAGYAAAARPARARLAARQPAVVVGVGQVSDAQKQLLDMGLVHAYVGIDFPLMGQWVYRALRAAADGEALPRKTILPVATRRPSSPPEAR